jgi:hypothetical protein
MANDHVKMFAEEYGPVAVQVSQKTGIAPSVLLAQWGMESNYGRSPVGDFNLGNIKDMSGGGREGKDNKTGSKDKYINFESPEAFGDYYSHFIRRLYPNALNAGTDISKYSQGLNTGVKGSYFEDSLEEYEDKVRGAHKTTTGFYKDPEEIATVKPMTEAERIKQDRLDAGTTDEPPKPEPKETIDPATGALAGAGFSALGQIPFDPQMPAKAPDLASLEDAAKKAKVRADIAERRLQQRMSSTTPIAGGADLDALEAEYKRTQFFLKYAEEDLQKAVNAQKAKVPSNLAATTQTAPQAGSMASATPQIITDPDAPIQTAQERVLQGTIDPETGTTGRQRQGYNEITSYQALLREQQQKALAEAQKLGLVKDVGESARIAFGAPSSTPSGLLVQPDVAAPLNAQAELEQRMADDKAAQERLAQQEEMQRLKNERALSVQQNTQAQKAFEQAQKAKASGVARAQTAAETAADRQAAAQADLASGRKLAKTAPGMVTRPLEVTGVKSGKAGMVTRAGIGAIGGLQAARGINELANMPIEELIKRYQAGERSPELLAAIQQVAGAGAQTGFGAAATVPVIGPKTARIKGAGAIGTGLMGAYEGYKALTEKEPQ